MSLRVSNIVLPVESSESELPREISQVLGMPAGEIKRWRILRKSLDARARSQLRFVYTVLVELQDHAAEERAAGGRFVERYQVPEFWNASPGSRPLPNRPVVIGSGPAGLLAAYYLAVKGFRPIVLERGKAVKERVPAIRTFDSGGAFDRENNYLFGEGGAGTFSDGKLTCRLSGPDVDWVLERIVEFGGKPSIVYEQRPHLGSNRLPMIVRNFRRKIEALGGEYCFDCRMEGLEVADGRLAAVLTSSGRIATTQAVLAIGHSARDSYRMLHELGIPMTAKAFQLGLRIEQPQAQVNRHKYARPDYLDLLGAADYTVVARGKRDLYSFCMCAGGYVIPSISEPEMFCTNGMSNSRHDTEFANSGMMITLEPREFGSEHPLAGVELQRRYEAVAYELGRKNYLCPIQPAADFLDGRPAEASAHYECSYQRGVVPGDLSGVLPPGVIAAIRSGLPVIDAKWKGEFLRNAMLVGPEMRGSSPVRIERDRETMQSPAVAGLYPVGEGAGFAGGIITAAVDGLRAARVIVSQFAAVDERVSV